MVVDPLDVLWRGGIHYLQPRGRAGPDPASARERPEPQDPGRGEPGPDEVAAAFAALASSGDPRQAEAMVAALLWRPDWDLPAAEAVGHLPSGGPAHRELLLAHTAAAYLGRNWLPVLRLHIGPDYTPVPDRFAAQLGLPPAADDPWEARWNVAMLAARRQAEDGADFAAEFDRIVHHLEGQMAVEHRLATGGAQRVTLR